MDCNCDFGDCGDCSGLCEINDCGCGDCKDCVNDCCDCSNLDCDCDNLICRDICQQCLGNPTANESRLRRFIAAIIALFLVLAQWITSIKNISTYSDNKYKISNLQNIINYGPINDIGIYSKCPQNTILFSNYTIPSTISGCYDSTYNRLYNTTCNQTGSQWITIGISNAITTQHWGYEGTKQQYQLCGRRTEITFKQLKTLKVQATTDCRANNLTLCQDVKDRYNFYCVNKTDKCPIRDLKMDAAILEGYERADQAVKEDKYFQFTRNLSTEQYLINFNITRGQGICINRDALSAGDGEDYPLNYPKWSLCDLDLTFQQFLNLSLPTFLGVNGVNDTFMSTRLQFNYSQNMILLAQKSMNTLNILKFSSVFDDIETSISHLTLIVYLSLAYWIYIIVILINECGRCIFKAAESVGQNCKRFVTIFLFYIIRLAIQAPLIVLTLIGFFTINQCGKDIDLMTTVLQIDYASRDMVDFSTSISKTIKSQYFVLQGLVFAQLGIDLIIAIWAYYAERKKTKASKHSGYNLPGMVGMTYLAQSGNNNKVMYHL